MKAEQNRTECTAAAVVRTMIADGGWDIDEDHFEWAVERAVAKYLKTALDEAKADYAKVVRTGEKLEHQYRQSAAFRMAGDWVVALREKTNK